MPARLLVFDTATGEMVASPEIVGDTDDLFYDAARSRVYIIGGQGFIDVLHQKDPDRYERIALSRAARYPHGTFRARMGKAFCRRATPRRAPCEILVFEAK